MNLVVILFAHWFADFVCQKREWAEKKHLNTLEGVGALVVHITVYTIMLAWTVLMLTRPVGTMPGLLTWAGLNGLLHLATDAITSRLFHKFEHTNRSLAIKIFGFDQFIHSACLIATAGMIGA